MTSCPSEISGAFRVSCGEKYLLIIFCDKSELNCSIGTGVSHKRNIAEEWRSVAGTVQAVSKATDSLQTNGNTCDFRLAMSNNNNHSFQNSPFIHPRQNTHGGVLQPNADRTENTTGNMQCSAHSYQYVLPVIRTDKAMCNTTVVQYWAKSFAAVAQFLNLRAIPCFTSWLLYIVLPTGKPTIPWAQNRYC